MAQRKTYAVKKPYMKGPGIKAWQKTVKALFKKLGIDCPITADGVYGLQSRTYTAMLFKAMGYGRTTLYKKGLTPELRDKVGGSKRTKTELKNFHAKTTVAYRKKIRADLKPKKVHKPVSVILADSWDYHPGVHDGIDVVCRPNAPVYAMVKAKVIDSRSGNWWGKAPSGDVSKGDGIVQLQVLENVGPFKKGMHLGYGHVEHSRVRVGQIVQAGDHIATAGLAVAWHVHLMVNSGNTSKGIGNINPRAILNYVKKHG